MNIHLVSLGCARNLVDSEGMLGLIKKAGWEITDDPEDAHVIIVNTCSFIESAAEESIDTILEMAQFKDGKCRSLIVAGCLPERYGKDIASELEEVDLFLGTGAFDRIVDAVNGTLKGSKCILPDPDSIIIPGPGSPRELTLPYMAYLKIAEGCSRGCTYCIIPKLRGKQKSRQPEHILAESKTLIKSGVKEIVLIAQDTTAYGRDLGKDANLSYLLRDISDLSDNLEADIWIRILYGHPESIDDNIIKIITERSNLCSYFDLPVQHAASSVLKKMGRSHNRDDLYRLFEKIRTADTEAALRTTVITGFPGETDKDFQLLLDFIEDIRFDNLGVFIYSDSEDLPSHNLPDHVPAKTARERYDILMSRQMEISLEINEKYLNKNLKVLVEESPEPDVSIGRTGFQAPEVDGMVYINHSTALKPGDFANIKITDTLEYDLVGEIK
ncbi:Ribosomal protein S12 methylthiotransferase RimO [Desulfonema limicola]|uniref:Ribosomal protein uS12 methylthiotransferase RimO n=1 Tax=Desulfonema limicola TaxID=45656 RepID=A0A975B3C1_9BACT|nr:30S ribosomal protein S12 methylthiotransferase RimO [Desulfonema limicola]QTA78034.1 Ribosomal protein S12 methylthiotransferase RimO [Desulfonema limicola]